MNKFLIHFLLFFSVFHTLAVKAQGLSSDWVKVIQLRPITSGKVYFVVDKVAICNTNSFLMKITDNGSKAVYSTLLAAAMSGKKIKLETWRGCATSNGGWGTEIEAIKVKFP
ncbi:hypothetical protein AADZ84_13175 [Colwelliaceae bacterium MEBiC 14330]